MKNKGTFGSDITMHSVYFNLTHTKISSKLM